MKENGFTELEEAVIANYHSRLKSWGFPPLKDLAFVRRVHTGGGKYIYVSHPVQINLPDCILDHDQQIDLDCLVAGLCVYCSIKDGFVEFIEFVVNGEQNWNGSETGWKFIGD